MVNDRFIELLTKKLSDEISSEEYDEFKSLLAQDAECKRQYSSFKSYWVQDEEHWANTDFLFQKIKGRITDSEQEETNIVNTERRKIFTFWRSIAAILIAGVCLFAYSYFTVFKTANASTASLELMHTPSRTKSKIVLSDGTVVTLNSETALKYPATFTGDTREVYLNGEAFFEVTKDHKHPFIVHTKKMSVRVLGTAFNVKSYANDASSETTLIRGAIEVTLADRPSDKIILKPSEKLILKNNNIAEERSNHKDLAAVKPEIESTKYALTNLTHFKSNDSTIVETSWVGNRLVFKDENFIELANQMERWYGVKIKFKNDELKEYHFTGIFERESVLQALSALQMIEPFHYKIKNESVYIY